MSDVYASDQSLFHVALERANTEYEDDRAGIWELLMAIDALTQGWLHPLGVGFQVVHCDPEQDFEEVGRPATPHHFLRETGAPDDVRVREAFANSAVSELPLISAEMVRQSITQELDQPVLAGAVATLSELTWTAVRALAPIVDPIRLEVGGRPASSTSRIIDRQRWYYGPTDAPAGPPARLRAVNDHFLTRIQLDVFWDLWIGNPAGRILLETGVARVLARAGWERTA